MGLVERCVLSDHFPEIGHRDFYRDLFPVGALEARGEYVDGRYCGIAVQVVGKAKAKRYSVTDDLDVIDDIVASRDFCIMSPVSYAGKSQKQEALQNITLLSYGSEA